MPDEILLNEAAEDIWVLLDSVGRMGVRELANTTKRDQSQVMAIATEAAAQGFFEIKEREREELTPAESARGLIAAELPEFRVARKLQEAGGILPMAEVASWAKTDGVAINEAIKWGSARGAVERIKTDKGAALQLTDSGRQLLKSSDADLR